MTSSNIQDYTKEYLDPYIKNIGAKRDKFNTYQQGQETDFLNRYRNAILGQQPISALAQRREEELGIVPLRQATQGLEQTMAGLPQTYSNATRGFDVNANQLGRIVGTQQAKIGPLAEQSRSALNEATGLQSQLLGYDLAQQEKELLPFQSEQALLSDRLARESTGYSQDAERELNGILEKMKAGIQLSEAELQRAHELSLAEWSYKQAVKVAELNLEGTKYTADNKSSSSDPLGLF